MNLTYKQVLDDFFTVISDHKMIKTAGYGPLSEIKVPRGTYDTNYPYAFLQPTNHTLGQHQMTYRFNLIMMEMCNDDIDSVITAQSDCLQYVKDILGRFYYSYPDYDFTVNFSVTPFKEVYDDTVSGVTATIELVTRDALDNCIAPFEPFFPDEPLVFARNTVERLIDPDPGQGDTAYVFNQILVTDGNWTNTNRYEVPVGGSGFYRITAKLIFKLVEPAVGEVAAVQPVVRVITGPPNVSTEFAGTISEPWPTFETANTVYTRDMEFTFFATAPPTVNDFTLQFVHTVDTPGVPDASVIEMPNSEIKIFKED